MPAAVARARRHFPYGLVLRTAKALGVSRSMLTKSVACAGEYTEEQAGEMDRLGVAWDHLVAALAVKDRAERQRLLKAAADGRWTMVRLNGDCASGSGASRTPAADRRGGTPRASTPSRCWTWRGGVSSGRLR